MSFTLFAKLGELHRRWTSQDFAAIFRGMNNEEPQPQWELGKRLKAARGTMSARRAAVLAGISEGRWRQLEAGVQRVGGGLTVPARPKRETVIAMARAVGVDVNEALLLAGEDAEPALETVGAPGEADDFVATGSGGVAKITNEEVLARLRRMRQELDEIERGLSGGDT